MAGIKKDRLDRLYKRLTYRRLAPSPHTLTVHYHGSMISSGEYVDSFLGEYMDGRTPNASPVDREYPADAEIGGQTFTGFTGGRNVDQKGDLDRLPFANFQPGDIIFQTLADRVSDLTFNNVRYVELSSHPGKRFRYVGAQEFGLQSVYTTNVLLRRGSDAAADS